MFSFLKKRQADNKKMTLLDVQEIVQAYGTVMEKNVTGTIFRDENDLPYPKEKIKTALIAAIKLTEDLHTKEQLKSGYLMLAEWQSDIDKKNLLMSNAQNINSTSPEDVLKSMQYEQQWAEMTKKEAENLYNEIKHL